MSLSYLTLGVLAHVGGIPTQAYFDAPVSVGTMVDQQFAFGWQDNDMDPTGKFSFYFQATNLPPNGKPADLAGKAIPNGQDILIMDPNDVLTWDTSLEPAGTYYLYAVTTDEPLPPVFGMSRGVVTIQHAGDPLFPAVVITEPGAISPPVADAFAIQWEATGEGPLTATVRGKGRDDPGDLVVLAENVPMTAAAGGVSTGCYLWNLSAKPQGYYVVQVTVQDGASRTHTSYAVTNITLYRDPNVTDAGVPASCELAPAEPDAGTIDASIGGDDDGTGEGPCGCRVGRRAGAAGGLATLALIGLVGLAFTIRRQRR